MIKFIELTGAINGEKTRIKVSAITRVEYMPSENRTAVHMNDTQKCVAVIESADFILETIEAEILKTKAEIQYNASAILKHKPPTDMFGKVINEGDAYFVVDGKSIHIESIEDYFIEVLGASVHERKKPLTARTVNGNDNI